MQTKEIIKFAVVGHPNEGKSSIVSTLAEDDSVKISPTPGETVVCRTYPVKIDGVDQIHFIDTPGFQLPRQTLAWMENYQGPGTRLIEAFIAAHQSDPDFQNECELLKPVAEGAAIIYVADASRPIRKHDKMEMAILRNSGRPRMALINNKSEATVYVDEWKNELLINFNTFRVFNAHRATYAERIDLLKCLKQISPDWQEAVSKVIAAFQTDWHQRNVKTAILICELIERCAAYRVSQTFGDKTDARAVADKLFARYQKDIQKIENRTYSKMRQYFKQNIFKIELPAQSILQKDLFHKETWKMLGLTSPQIAAVAATGGAVAGAAIDVAAAGITFGVFMGIGSLLSAGAALLWSRKIARIKIIGSRLSGYEMTVGPSLNTQFPFVLLDRVLICYSHMINWAHGRRDYQDLSTPQERDPHSDPVSKADFKKGFVSGWPLSHKQQIQGFCQMVQKDASISIELTRKQLVNIIVEELQQIGCDQGAKRPVD